MRLGFIGTGIISSALVTGFCESGIPDLSIIVSPRSRRRGSELAGKYPGTVQIADSNQEVLDGSDWIFLAVLPEQAETVLRELHFRPSHRLLNLVSSLGLGRAQEITGVLALAADVVPLPFNARRTGPIVLYPRIPEVKELLGHIGKVVAVDTPEQMAVLRSVTALMSSYYMLTATVVNWCREKGLEEEPARDYVTSFFGALNETAAGWEGELDDLAHEMTPGGLNWQILQKLTGQENFQGWSEALEPILERVTKQ